MARPQLVDIRRRIPHVGIVAAWSPSTSPASISTGCDRERGEDAVAEVVVAEAILDDQLGVLIREHVAGARLELVWIGGGIRQNRRHADALSAKLSNKVRVEVLDSQHAEWLRRDTHRPRPALVRRPAESRRR